MLAILQGKYDMVSARVSNLYFVNLSTASSLKVLTLNVGYYSQLQSWFISHDRVEYLHSQICPESETHDRSALA